MEKTTYADVWGDTVNLRHLASGMVIGIVISLAFYIGALKLIQGNFPKLPVNLMTAYSLLMGIVGCIISAVVSAKLFKPKRTLNEEEFSEADRNIILDELKVDRAKEAEELKTVEPAVVAEMKSLQLYELFVGKNDNKKVGE